MIANEKRQFCLFFLCFIKRMCYQIFRYLSKYLNIYLWEDIMGDVFKALSDPTCRKILELLQKEPLNAGEIANYFQITKPSISHHLVILKNCGLIIDERKGQNIIYSIDMTVLQDMMKWFMNFMDRGESDNEEKSI